MEITGYRIVASTIIFVRERNCNIRRIGARTGHFSFDRCEIDISAFPAFAVVRFIPSGLDIQHTCVCRFIHFVSKRIIAERDKGKAVIVVSFELDEILDMSDRIAVIYDGAIQGILDPAETNKQDLGILMAGGQLNKEEANV